MYQLAFLAFWRQQPFTDVLSLRFHWPTTAFLGHTHAHTKCSHLQRLCSTSAAFSEALIKLEPVGGWEEEVDAAGFAGGWQRMKGKLLGRLLKLNESRTRTGRCGAPIFLDRQWGGKPWEANRSVFFELIVVKSRNALLSLQSFLTNTLSCSLCRSSCRCTCADVMEMRERTFIHVYVCKIRMRLEWMGWRWRWRGDSHPPRSRLSRPAPASLQSGAWGELKWAALSQHRWDVLAKVGRGGGDSSTSIYGSGSAPLLPVSYRSCISGIGGTDYSSALW